MAITGKLKTGDAVAFIEEGKTGATLGIVTYETDESDAATVYVLVSLSDERQIAKSSLTERVNISDLEKTLNRQALGGRNGRPDMGARAELDRVHRLRQVQKIAPNVHAGHVAAAKERAGGSAETLVTAPTETAVASATETLTPALDSGISDSLR